MSGNTLVPNSYPKPNVYSDVYDYYLTPEESKVLDFIIRRILGFEENRPSRRDHISLSQICEGIKNRDGEYLTRGTGLSRPTAAKCIKSLVSFKFIAEIGKATQDGQEYELNRGQLGDIRLDLLEQRKADEQARETKRGQSIKSSKQLKAFTSKSHLLPTEEESSKSDIPPVVNDIYQGSKSDLPEVVNGINTQKPLETNSSKSTQNKQGEAAKAAALRAPAKSSKPVEEKGKPTRTTKTGKAVKETPEETAYYRACVLIVAQACNYDLGIDGVWAQCKKSLQALYHAEVRPTPELIEREFVAADGYWRQDHWKGKKGEFPEPHEFPNNWKRAMTWRDKPTLAIVGGNGNRSRGTPGANGDPNIDYLTIALEQETRRTNGRTIEGRFVNG